MQYTGVPLSEQLGFGWLEQVHRDERDRVREGWRAAVKAERRFDAEFRLRGPDGKHRWFKARAVPIRDSAGAVVKWYGASVDVHDLKQGERSAAPVVDGS